MAPRATSGEDVFATLQRVCDACLARRNTLFTVGGVVHATHAGQTTAIRGKNTCHRFGGQEGMIWRR
jgi:hypothetical protein